MTRVWSGRLASAMRSGVVSAAHSPDARLSRQSPLADQRPAGLGSTSSPLVSARAAVFYAGAVCQCLPGLAGRCAQCTSNLSLLRAGHTLLQYSLRGVLS